MALAALLALSLAPTTQARAEEALIEVVQAFLHQQFAGDDDQVIIEVHLPAAQMPPCRAPQPFLPNRSRLAQGRLSVGLRCGEQGQQVRYLQATIRRYGTYPVLRQEIAAGTTITAALLEQREGNLSDLPREAVLEPESIIGQVARRAIAAGVPLQQRQFESKPLVRRGQQVSVEARGTHFRVSREGKALDTGGLGDSVRVQFGNRDLINARVVGEGKLVVDF
ncbi:MAG: flagellar basal body P-ring formation chaperone FlgA [Lamprobacter sp.]|uniref:flagellar basal body P-ring formation chaperone FlgA n=1 Tax=Lamprobacter sp. TaxID=3100796 RepID=UPI002B258E98|nr:flagellar basal body P-ring formation chaperone FlgA [Lamprobacter sp.]MEA3639787.1 flagellar basal body P-ring formation chaperone FlgA [Lamprobacter sp.]